MMFNTILIANRGEIACRIARTATRLGMRTIAVYSDADADALHVRLCDEALRIGPAAAAASYLRIDRVIAAAKAMRADASIRATASCPSKPYFARTCVDAGIAWVGPPPAAIRAMGSRCSAKALMEKAGVPAVPGYHGDIHEPNLQQKADEIGYPVLIKAVPGAVARACAVSTACRLRRGARRREARGAIRLRRRGCADRESAYCAAPPRSADSRRSPWHARPSHRARVFGAAPPSESDRGGSRARHGRRVTRGHGRSRGRRRQAAGYESPARLNSSTTAPAG